MGLLLWQDDYDVGVELFNQQHKELFRIQNDASRAIAKKASGPEIFRLLNRLIRYAEFHFQEEERMMAQYGYPGLQKHQEQHGHLIDLLFSLTEDLARPGFKTDRLEHFLKDWIIIHILDEDRQYRNFFASI